MASTSALGPVPPKKPYTFVSTTISRARTSPEMPWSATATTCRRARTACSTLSMAAMSWNVSFPCRVTPMIVALSESVF